MTDRTCGRCQHFQIDATDLQSGACRRFPPTPMIMPRNTPQGPAVEIRGFWSPVQPTTGACGEFKSRIVIPEAAPPKEPA